ncbi:spermatogenesis-associated protein 31D1 [Nannospalax galili]|uniref:spermatogenesis-associated protein 31D1 n=1 Tax=Nannospalax galili TaxID=1026970 RepID=UPI000819FB49|nr:spermatogenesis-associated protein 31D1 [Nannospalax galili]
MPESSPQQPDADNESSFQLVRYTNKPLLDTHASQASFQGDRGAYFTEHGNLPSLSPGVLALFEKQEKRETKAIMSKHNKTKPESLPKALTWGEISESAANPQNLEVSLLLGNRKDKSVDPHVYQQPPNPKNSEDQLKAKDIQLFWGPPSLHSESLKPPPAALGDNSSICADFNRIAKASTASSYPTNPIPLSLPESDQQAWPKSLLQSQVKDVSHARPRAQPQSQIPDPLPSLAQFRICGVRLHRPQNEAQPLIPDEIHHIEFNILQKSGNVWGLPM